MNEPTRQEVALADLRVPTEYHQGVITRRLWPEQRRDPAVRAMQPYNPFNGGELTLSRRADGLYIIDGVQRRHWALEGGYTHMQALIFEGLTLEEEAKMFMDINSPGRRS